jgi:hypothetical protein
VSTTTNIVTAVEMPLRREIFSFLSRWFWSIAIIALRQIGASEIVSAHKLLVNRETSMKLKTSFRETLNGARVLYTSRVTSFVSRLQSAFCRYYTTRANRINRLCVVKLHGGALNLRRALYRSYLTTKRRTTRIRRCSD